MRATTMMILLAVASAGEANPEIAGFRPKLTRPADFRPFWQRQLAALPKVQVNVTEVPGKAKPGEGRVYDIRYPSADGSTEVWGWYGVPAAAQDGRKLPAVISIPAFRGRRGSNPPSFKDACGLVVGYRGHGDEPWPDDWITRGLDAPETSVFRSHYLNMVQAVRFLQSRPEVDRSRIYLQGGSLGGGMTVVVAGLLGKEIAGLVATVPGMAYYYYDDGRPAESSFRQMEEFVEKKTPAEKKKILRVLGYYAQINFAPDVTAEALFGAGGKDPLCFPRMVYGVYNHLGGPKQIRFYPEAAHGSGPGLEDDWPRTSRDWLEQRLTAKKP